MAKRKDNERMFVIVPNWMIDSHTNTITFVKLTQREELQNEEGYLGSNGINDYFSSLPHEEASNGKA